MRFLVLLLFVAGLARAEGERAGDFDYYVLSLSWSPTWCALEGDDRGSPQCDAAADFGWVLSLLGMAVGYGLAGPGAPLQRAIVVVVGGLWGGRLAFYLLRDRILGEAEEDGRYARLRCVG